MKKIQSSCIQTVLEMSGKLSHYRATLHITQEIAELLEWQNVEKTRKGWM